MANITATLAPSDEIVVTKFAELPANFTLSQLTDTTITSPSDGSFLVYDNSSTRWIDDQTIVKTSTGITLSGTLVATALDISGDIDVDGTLEADAITVNGITLAETISDTVGAMVGSNTESGIAVTYDDSDNTLDFNVDDFSITLTGDVTGSGTVTNLGNVSFATTIQAGSLENDMLAGSIANAKLSNSTVSYGGISLALGANDDTPAFNLQDATGYPTSSLVGTITNAQLSNSTVNFGGVSVALGASDTTPAFDLQHATNLPTSALTGDMPNARIVVGNVTQHQAALSVATSQLSGNITNAQLANSSITVSDGSNTSPVALGGTLTFAGTSNEVTVAENAGTVTVGLPDDVTITGDLSVADAPTAGAHVTNKTYVDAKVAALVDSAPDALDTLNELAVALGNDASYATTTASTIGGKLAKASNLSDLTNAGTARTNLGLGTAATTAATAYATAAQGTKADNALVASTVSTFGATIIDDANAGAARTTLGLGTAATTAATAYAPAAGSTNITTVGTIGTGTWQGTAIVDTYISSASTWNAKQDALTFGKASGNTLKSEEALVTNDVLLMGSANVKGRTYSEFKTDISLNNVENTAISTFAGTTNITTVGTLTSLTAGQITSNATKFELTDTTDSASAGPAIELYRNGGNGSNNDELGIIRFYGNNATGNKTEFATIYSEILNNSGSGRLHFGVSDAGSIRDVMILTASGVLELNEVSPSAGSGPRIDLVRDNSNSSDEDEIGSIQFKARDDAGNTTTYAEIYSEIADASNTAETGEIRFKTITAGSNIDPMLTLSGAGSTLTSSLTLGATSATVGGKILFKEGTNGGTNAVSLIGPATTADVTVTLPNATGTLALTTSNVSSATLASTVTVANSTANTDFPVVFHDESNGLLDDTGALTYNPSTGALVSSGTISAYVSASEAAQLRAGREDGQDISIFCSDTINSIVADQDTDADADQQFVLNRTFNGNAAQSSNNSYFKIQNNGSTELEIKGGWSDNSASETTLNTTLTTGATTINGALTVNSDTLKLTSTTASSTVEHPSLELYRNGGVGSADLGAIKFFGNNNATTEGVSTPEKFQYAGIYASVQSGVDGVEQGSLAFSLGHNGLQEDPAMSLFSYGLQMGYGNPILMSYSNGYQQFFSPDAAQKSFKLNATPNATVPNGIYEINLPDVEGGTLAVINSDKAFTAGATTVNGALTVSSGITGSQTISIVTDTSIDVTEFATYNGKKIIYTGGAGTIILADAVAADIGKAWVIINAGTGAITIDRTTSTQTIKLLNGSSVSAGSANLTVATGGVIEVICTAADNYITFGSGVS